MKLTVENRFTNELPADVFETNEIRKVFHAAYSKVNPTPPSSPSLIHVIPDVLDLIGISSEESKSEDFLAVFSGKKVYPNTQPYAMCYGGHQFGTWAGQLGDGRAINLFEVRNQNQWHTLQLKGAGKTPYSRTADGLAVLRSSIREYLCAEAMYYLNVPTTRSLSLILSGDHVLRDILYNGNPAYEKGAIVCRVAPSFIRFGNFEILASRNETVLLQQLADFTIQHFFPEIQSTGIQKYVAFFDSVAQRTLDMIIHWQRVGFVHGVMNTDNMSIHGITIDYGPYGWLEDYDPSWTPNTTDSQQHRYAFGNQPEIALWNLYQLANALYPIIQETEGLEKTLQAFEEKYNQAYLDMMRSKLGLEKEIKSDSVFISELTQLLATKETDMTLFFRELAHITINDSTEIALNKVQNAFYNKNEITGEIQVQWKNWFTKYQERLAIEARPEAHKIAQMNRVNPKYVLRNYMAQLAIDAADKGDYTILKELQIVLKKPYDDQPEYERWYAKRPDWAREKIGCSMLSCSS